MRAGKRQEAGILPLLPLPMMKVPGKGVTKAGTGARKRSNNVDHMDKYF